MDIEDGVLRCPQCNWEIEDEAWGCYHCGFRDDMDDDESSDGIIWADYDESTGMSEYDDEDEVEDGFGDADDDFYEHDPLGHLNRDRPGEENSPPHLDDFASARDETLYSDYSGAYDSDEIGSLIEDDEAEEGRDGDEEIPDSQDEDYRPPFHGTDRPVPDSEDEDRHPRGDSVSDESTVVGGPGYSIRDLHDDVQTGPSDSEASSPYHDAHERTGDEEEEEEEDSQADDDEDPYEPAPQAARGNGWRAPRALGLPEDFALRSLDQFARTWEDDRDAGGASARGVSVSDDSDMSPPPHGRDVSEEL